MFYCKVTKDITFNTLFTKEIHILMIYVVTYISFMNNIGVFNKQRSGCYVISRPRRCPDVRCLVKIMCNKLRKTFHNLLGRLARKTLEEVECDDK